VNRARGAHGRGRHGDAWADTRRRPGDDGALPASTMILLPALKQDLD
jgi:hypothetical protein